MKPKILDDDSNVLETLRNLPSDVVLVVGGGVVGLSAAAELTARGHPVVVVDRHRVGEGAGIGSAGHLVPGHVVPFASPGMARTAIEALLRPRGAMSVRWRDTPSLARWGISFLRHCTAANVASAAPALGRLAELSMSVIAELEADDGLRVDRRGMLDAYADSAAFEAAAHHARLAADHGVTVEIVDAHRVRALEPVLRAGVVGGVHYPDDASVDPAALLTVLARRAVDQGAILLDGVDVMGFERAGRGEHVQTSHGNLMVRHVVVAAGAWSSRLGVFVGRRVPVVAGQGLSVTFDRPVNGPRLPMLLGEHHVAVAVTDETLRLSGWFRLGAMSTTPSSRRLDLLEALARRRLDLPLDLRVRNRWAGLRPVTPDGVPLIGSVNGRPDVTIATGHGMIGVTMGPGTGRIVAQLVSGEDPAIDLARFDPMRFS